MRHLILIILLASFVAFDSEILRLEASEISKADLESKTVLISSNSSESNVSNDGSKSTVDSNNLNQVEKDKEGLGKVKEVDKSEKDHSKEHVELVAAQDKDSRKGLESQREAETGKKDVSVKTTKNQQQQQVSQSEDCDPSNRCTANDNALIACLRVPGSESSALSLLIQNKGKADLTINISAPDFVSLENNQVHLQEKENLKVKISITKSGRSNNGNMIVLSSGNGDCNLDIKDLITQYSEQKQIMQIVFIRRNTIIVCLLIVSLLVVALTCTYVSFRKKRLGSMKKYQRLDEETLPVVSTGKRDQDQPLESNDGWDNGWGDNWDEDDDEEAPSMPLTPLTPSLSSKGLASRKVSKDGWND